jgi:PilZ domain
MGDRRAVQRTRVLRCAMIILSHQPQVLRCTVENITSMGACLKLANGCGLPPTFDLTFDYGRTRRLCRVVWRRDDLLGVRFDRIQYTAEA